MWVLFLKDLFILERVHEQGERQREREREADSLLSVEPDAGPLRS